MNNNFPKKILIIRQGAIGDVVHTTETYRSIKRLLPDSEIHYLTTKTPAELLENDRPDKTYHIAGQELSGIVQSCKRIETRKIRPHNQPPALYQVQNFLLPLQSKTNCHLQKELQISCRRKLLLNGKKSNKKT